MKKQVIDQTRSASSHFRVGRASFGNDRRGPKVHQPTGGFALEGQHGVDAAVRDAGAQPLLGRVALDLVPLLAGTDAPGLAPTAAAGALGAEEFLDLGPERGGQFTGRDGLRHDPLPLMTVARACLDPTIYICILLHIYTYIAVQRSGSWPRHPGPHPLGEAPAPPPSAPAVPTPRARPPAGCMTKSGGGFPVSSPTRATATTEAPVRPRRSRSRRERPCAGPPAPRTTSSRSAAVSKVPRGATAGATCPPAASDAYRSCRMRTFSRSIARPGTPEGRHGRAGQFERRLELLRHHFVGAEPVERIDLADVPRAHQDLQLGRGAARHRHDLPRRRRVGDGRPASTRARAIPAWASTSGLAASP